MSSEEASMPPGTVEYKSKNVLPISREFHEAVEQGSATKDLSGRYYRALETYAEIFEGRPWTPGQGSIGGLDDAVRSWQAGAASELQWIEAEKLLILKHIGESSKIIEE